VNLARHRDRVHFALKRSRAQLQSTTAGWGTKSEPSIVATSYKEPPSSRWRAPPENDAWTRNGSSGQGHGMFYGKKWDDFKTR